MPASTRETLKGSSIVMLRLLGGRLCLDFTNTVDPRTGGTVHDFLGSYADLVTWSTHVKILTENKAQHLLNEATLRPNAAIAALKQAIRIREMLYRIFSSIAHKENPAVDDLAELQHAYMDVLAYAQIVPSAESFTWNWSVQKMTLDPMLQAVICSAIELLFSQEIKRVKECPGLGDCGWLFLDTSKNGSRQWCSMEGCGSRAKMRQHYARTRAHTNSYIQTPS